jgi:hypothetical protein
MSQKNLMAFMQSLDDAWNARDWETFKKLHSRDTAVKRPGIGAATKDIHEYISEIKEFLKAFPDSRVDSGHYKAFITQGSWTCSVAKFTGTMTGLMKMPKCEIISPTNRPFEVDLCTVAHWLEGEVVRKNIFYDLASFKQQVGLE